MAEYATPAVPAARPLLPEVFALLAAQRPAFTQDRPFHRAEALGVGWLCAVGRRTITQTLLALGEGGTDWSGWYRLFSTPRLDYDRLTASLLGEVLPLAPAAQPFAAVVDGLSVPRTSRTMPGTAWAKHPGTPVFKPGIHRAQRFVDLAWLPAPTAAGYSRAVPLRLEPAFPRQGGPGPGAPPAHGVGSGAGGPALAADRTGRRRPDRAAAAGPRRRQLQQRRHLGRTPGGHHAAGPLPPQPGAVSAAAPVRREGAAPALRGARPPPGRLAGHAPRLAARRAAGARPDDPARLPGRRALPRQGRARPAALPAGGPGQRSAPRQAAARAGLLAGQRRAARRGLAAAAAAPGAAWRGPGSAGRWRWRTAN